jgi:hypothetical protein
MLAKGTNKMIILLIGSPMNRLRNFTLSHNEISTAKTDHKNEISTKNWVESTWVAKSQLWKKSTLLVKVNAKSQLWSMEKSTLGQRKKSTLGQRKKSTLVNEKVNARADVALC